jgi:carbon-monoxide dehydrogenase small subunit
LKSVEVTINGQPFSRTVEPRLLLSDFLRHELGLTGTHVGCEHGVCGACTVLLDGEPVRSCLQEAFREAHGLQCGFCTAGILMTLEPFLEQNREPSEEEIRHALSGNLCRCTGYQHIVDAVKLAAAKMGSPPER